MTTGNAQAGKETSVTNAPPLICHLPAVVDQNVASTSILPLPIVMAPTIATDTVTHSVAKVFLGSSKARRAILTKRPMSF